MNESLKDKLTMLAYITEKDYKTNWDGSAMTICELDSGRVVTSGSEEHCEKCVDIILLLFRMV
jgi:hypothetical protein